MKAFKVWFSGSSLETIIYANNRKEAKEIFATQQNTIASSYVHAREI